MIEMIYTVPLLILAVIIQILVIASKDWMGAITALAVFSPVYFLIRFLVSN